MSDIPEACLTAAQVIYDNLECRLLADESTNKERRSAERDDLVLIARALMAADEAATKRERERCAGIVLDRMPATQDMNPVTDALEDVYTTILKGES